MKTRPEIGAEKAAERPAAAPAVKYNFSSVLLFPNFSDSHLALLAPNWIEGPSLPKESPTNEAIAPPTILETVTLKLFWLNAPISSPWTCGIPLPPESGAHLSNLLTTIPRTNDTAIIKTALGKLLLE